MLLLYPDPKIRTCRWFTLRLRPVRVTVFLDW